MTGNGSWVVLKHGTTPDNAPAGCVRYYPGPTGLEWVDENGTVSYPSQGATGPQGLPGTPLGDINWRGAWSGATTYAAGEGVIHDDIAYVSIVAGNLNHEPPNTTYWVPVTRLAEKVVDVTEYGATGDGITDDSAAITSAITAAETNGTLYFPAGVYACHGLSIARPINITGAGAAVTRLKNNLNGSTVLTICYDGMADQDMRRPVKIDGISWEDTTSGTGIGLLIERAYFITVENTYFEGFRYGKGLQCKEALWVFVDNICTFESEVCFNKTTLNNNQVYIKHGELRIVTTYGLYVEGATTVGIDDLTVEEYTGTPSAGIYIKDSISARLSNLYVERLEGATDAIHLDRCQGCVVKESTVSASTAGIPAIHITECANILIESSTLIYEPVKIDAASYGIRIRQCSLWGKLDIPDSTDCTIEDCTTTSATVIVLNPKYQPETYLGKGIPFSNSYADSSFADGIPTVSVLSGSPTYGQDTTTGYYDQNSLNVSGASGDKVRVWAVGETSVTGGAIISFMGKASDNVDVLLEATISDSAGTAFARMTTGWRRYFFITTLGHAANDVHMAIELFSTHQIWIDDIQVVPITSYNTIPKNITHFRYVWTHGATISNDVRRVEHLPVFFEDTINMRKLTVAPASPTDGDIAYADGSGWNPGGGAGIYARIGSSWVKLG